MEWRDQGMVLAVRPHGETSVIAEVFTRDHGRHAGIVRGGVSRKLKGVLQPGAQVDVVWKARLEGHMGAFTIEPVRSRMAGVLNDPLRLSALSALCATAVFCLPEREGLTAFQAQTEGLADAIASGKGWLSAYMWWEIALLQQMGFGLDLAECANGGGSNDLAFVSPRTGRAVSRSGAGPWADRLLPLPECLLGGVTTLAGVQAALHLTGHFLTHKLAPSMGDRPMPPARGRFVGMLARQ
jgi:DNA repair protein RecO (recombination protein O)